MTNALDELLDFLKPEARLDLKAIAVDNLLGLSGSEEGAQTLIKNSDIIRSVLSLTSDNSDEIAKSALCLFVNLTATEIAAKELFKLNENCVKTFIGYVLDPQKKNADAACMILSNITRLENELETCVDIILPRLNEILNVFIDIGYNKKNSNLDYLAPMFSNLSRSPRVREWLTNKDNLSLLKLLPFCNYQQSAIRRGGVIGTIRNLSFSTEYHDLLLSPEVDLLTYILNPLMGNDEYNDEEMDQLPIDLQYLPREKQRDPDVDIRKMIIEILNRLCTKRNCREILRNNGVYYVLREYHKWEKDANVLLACENVVDILIRKENEIGVDDLSSVEVPEHMKEEFIKFDTEFIKNCK